MPVVRCKTHGALEVEKKPNDCRLCVFDLKAIIAELEGNKPADEAPTTQDEGPADPPDAGA